MSLPTSLSTLRPELLRNRIICCIPNPDRLISHLSPRLDGKCKDSLPSLLKLLVCIESAAGNTHTRPTAVYSLHDFLPVEIHSGIRVVLNHNFFCGIDVKCFTNKIRQKIKRSLLLYGVNSRHHPPRRQESPS